MAPQKRIERDDLDEFYMSKKFKPDASSARSQVFGFTELLGNILSFLPPKNIFGVQRVCGQWKDVIARDRRIQEKLFLRRQDSRKNASEPMMLDATGTLKPIPAHAKPEMLFVPVSLNPLFSSDFHQPCQFIDNDPRIINANSCLHLAGFILDSYYKPHSSLLNAFITDPPARATNVVLHYESSTVNAPKLTFRIRLAETRAAPATFRDLVQTILHGSKDATACDYSSSTDSSRAYMPPDQTVAEFVEEMQVRYSTSYDFGASGMIFMVSGISAQGSDAAVSRA